MGLSINMPLLPCLNPQCKSHGKPHPNCKCYTKNSDGGRVEHFCSSDNSHDQGCEYYAGGGDVPQDDLPVSGPKMVPKSDLPDQSSGIVPHSDLPESEDKYGGTGEGALAGLEGVAHGFISKPLTNLLESGLSHLGVPDIKPEDIAGREEAHPYIHGAAETVGLGAGLLTGVGEAGLIAKGAAKLLPKAVEAAGLLNKFRTVGIAALKGAVESGAIQAGDEIGNAMLHDNKGDQSGAWSSALSNIGMASLLGFGVGGAGSMAKQSLKAAGEAKLGTKARDFITGMGWAASPEAEIPGPWGGAAFNAGVKYYKQGINKAVKNSTEALINLAGTGAGYLGIGGPMGAAIGTAAGKIAAPYLEKIVDRPITGMAQKYVPEVMTKVMSGGDFIGLWNAIDYAANVSKGAQKITNGVEKLFQYGGQQIIDDTGREKRREDLKKYVESGAQNQQVKAEDLKNQDQSFAHGGEVKQKELHVKPILDGTEAISSHWPAQAMMMGAAKSRINGYLNSIRPLPPAGALPFDDHREDKHHKRAYDKAIDLANSPLSVLNHIKSGKLDPETMKHFTSLFPDLHDHLSKKITEKIVQLQMKGEKPPYKIRQSLSYFLGAPLDTTFTPTSIQAAQSVFMNKAVQQAQAGQAKKVKRGTAPLSKISEEYQTSSQASVARQRNS